MCPYSSSSYLSIGFTLIHDPSRKVLRVLNMFLEVTRETRRRNIVFNHVLKREVAHIKSTDCACGIQRPEAAKFAAVSSEKNHCDGRGCEAQQEGSSGDSKGGTSEIHPRKAMPPHHDQVQRILCNLSVSVEASSGDVVHY